MCQSQGLRLHGVEFLAGAAAFFGTSALPRFLAVGLATASSFSPSSWFTSQGQYPFFFLFFLQVLCLLATLWVMTDLPPVLYVHVYTRAWLEAPYYITVSAFSRRNLLVAFGLPLLSPSLSFYCLASELISLSWSLLLCHSSSLSLAPSLLPTPVPFKNFNTGPTARSFANKLPSHLHSGRGCQLIPCWPSSLLSFLRSLLHLRHSV